MPDARNHYPFAPLLLEVEFWGLEVLGSVSVRVETVSGLVQFSEVVVGLSGSPRLGLQIFLEVLVQELSSLLSLYGI